MNTLEDFRRRLKLRERQCFEQGFHFGMGLGLLVGLMLFAALRRFG